MELLVKLMNGKAPERRDDSAGYDCFNKETLKIPSLKSVKFGLGFAAAFDPRWVALLLDRSSMGNKGLLRLAGVIEGTYRDEWKAILYNTSHETFIAAPETRIIQAVFVEYKVWNCVRIVNELPPSDRAAGGFGSSEVLDALKSQNLKLIDNYSADDLKLAQDWIVLGMLKDLKPGCVVAS